MTEEKTISERLSAIEKRLDRLGDEVEEAAGAAAIAQEAAVRLERLIEYEVIRPLQKPASLDDVRDKLNELLEKIG